MILVHGRGASAADILSLVEALPAGGMAFFAPQAAGGTWYPYRFIEPVERNEPYLTSALQVLDDCLAMLVAANLASDRVMLLGFSQGGCLALEYAARHPRRYGGVVALSGALIGDGDRLRTYPGSLVGTPLLLGCSDRDPHIPLDRLRESARILGELGASVDLRVYPAMGHMVNEDELSAVGTMIKALLAGT